jgi:hypothetical protein
LSQINEIPKLTSGCTEFIESAEQILEKRKMNQTMLANHSTLLDLLEIPQLMDTYVNMIKYVVTLVEFPVINCPTCCMYVKTYVTYPFEKL